MAIAVDLKSFEVPRNLEEAHVLALQLYLNLKLWLFSTYYPDTYTTETTNESIAWGLARLLRDVFVVYLAFGQLVKLYRYIRGYGVLECIRQIYNRVSSSISGKVMSLPPIKAKIDKELASTIVKMEQEIIKNDDGLLQFPSLPAEGIAKGDISQELDKLKTLKHSDWVNGRVSGAVYHGGDELLQLQVEAYDKYSVANQLHPDVFPGVRKMEAEVVHMVLDIFNAPPSGCGATTSGGTESLLLTGLAAREYGRKYKGITEPEVIAPVTIHAGIEKACFYFGMKLHKVELDPVTYQVDTKKVERLINSNTVLLCGSAPNYPHGIIDDFQALSDLAVKYKIPLHVDACLGSFIVSFLERSKVHKDIKLPKFDFRLPGVTSISCDTHKYGFAPKGSSIIMYRDPKLRECQYYISSDWTGGMYGSPTLAGSRPGALVVGCWATLIHIGKEGYTKFCYDIVLSAMKLRRAIEENPTLSKYLEIIGDPIGSVIAFRIRPAQEDNLSIYEISDLLSKKGWHFATLQNPPALHFALTRLTVPVIDELIDDLEACTKDAVRISEEHKNGGIKKKQSDTAALYGIAGSVHTAGLADRLISAFLDALYKI
ncbi:Sphingosine-1-phosphate lyase [Candida viswanathii]|uniref:sphinganine-1-phosphate aldolase n=1 Tax=Candida viswanathii TaxID=5486 RepID=A0A367YFG4_9ASCO|nr:Sphingosine-1-phosphate lyase [Candida viswanathii]